MDKEATYQLVKQVNKKNIIEHYLNSFAVTYLPPPFIGVAIQVTHGKCQWKWKVLKGKKHLEYWNVKDCWASLSLFSNTSTTLWTIARTHTHTVKVTKFLWWIYQISHSEKTIWHRTPFATTKQKSNYHSIRTQQHQTQRLKQSHRGTKKKEAN